MPTDGLGKRIRSAKLDKLPYVLVVGDDEWPPRPPGSTHAVGRCSAV